MVVWFELKGSLADWTAFTAGTVEGASLRTGLMKTVHNYAFDAETPLIQNIYDLGADGKPEHQSGAISSTYGSMFAIQARRYALTFVASLALLTHCVV